MRDACRVDHQDTSIYSALGSMMRVEIPFRRVQRHALSPEAPHDVSERAPTQRWYYPESKFRQTRGLEREYPCRTQRQWNILTT